MKSAAASTRPPRRPPANSGLTPASRRRTPLPLTLACRPLAGPAQAELCPTVSVAASTQKEATHVYAHCLNPEAAEPHVAEGQAPHQRARLATVDHGGGAGRHGNRLPDGHRQFPVAGKPL